jgi:hypothetical protein
MFRLFYFLLFGFVYLAFLGTVFKPLVIDSSISPIYKGLLAAAFTALTVYVIKRISKLGAPNFSDALKKFVPLSVSNIDNAHWEAALDEINKSTQSKALWAKCIAESNGNVDATKSIYIRRRAAELHNAAKEISAVLIDELMSSQVVHRSFVLTDEMKVMVDELTQIGCTIKFNESSLTVITPNGKIFEDIQKVFELESLLVELSD